MTLPSTAELCGRVRPAVTAARSRRRLRAKEVRAGRVLASTAVVQDRSRRPSSLVIIRAKSSACSRDGPVPGGGRGCSSARPASSRSSRSGRVVIHRMVSRTVGGTGPGAGAGRPSPEAVQVAADGLVNPSAAICSADLAGSSSIAPASANRPHGLDVQVQLTADRRPAEALREQVGSCRRDAAGSG